MSYKLTHACMVTACCAKALGHGEQNNTDLNTANWTTWTMTRWWLPGLTLPGFVARFVCSSIYQVIFSSFVLFNCLLIHSYVFYSAIITQCRVNTVTDRAQWTHISTYLLQRTRNPFNAASWYPEARLYFAFPLLLLYWSYFCTVCTSLISEIETRAHIRA